ncbi:MAG: hypothetical protein J4F32_07020 [Dehalococcoidia bacterium]|nr:hypothetical protein [Dehalococcoidia bacterium]
MSAFTQSTTVIGLAMGLGLIAAGLLTMGLVLGAGMPLLGGLSLLAALDAAILIGGYLLVRRAVRPPR